MLEAAARGSGRASGSCARDTVLGDVWRVGDRADREDGDALPARADVVERHDRVRFVSSFSYSFVCSMSHTMVLDAKGGLCAGTAGTGTETRCRSVRRRTARRSRSKITTPRTRRSRRVRRLSRLRRRRGRTSGCSGRRRRERRVRLMLSKRRVNKARTVS